jgi:N-acetylated-alpha-linked acidic dipeptidase
MTSIPHLAGTQGDEDSALYVKNKWIEQGLDYAEMIDYDVLLSYPDDKKPNKYLVLYDLNYRA